MDKAKQTIAGFMSHDNEHKTTVDQDQRAAITEEHIRPQRHEEVTTAIDKEIHQDHHQTILQPIKHQEQLAEKHVHNAAAVQHKTFEHDKPEEAKAALDADAAKYRDSSITHDTEHSSSVAPTIQGEHVHHHLHQHVQPVIQKETIAPEVVHTTIPIHEVHHARSVNHGTTMLPAKTLQEFETEHGLKTRPAGTIGEFDGCAKSFVEGEQGSKIGSSTTGRTTAADTTATTATPATQQGRVKSLVDPAATGTRESRLEDKSSEDYKVASQAANRAFNDSSVPRSSAAGAGVVGAGAVGAGAAGNQLRQSSTAGSGSSGKVSLKDKLNPFKDADGDGKKGIMS